MEDLNNKRPNTKLGKYNYLISIGRHRQYLPETIRASADAIREMLNRHGMVYVKPNHGTGGYGVIKVVKRFVSSGEAYIYYYGTRSLEFADYESMYASLASKISDRTYLVQRGIQLLKYEGRPFDIRIMVQRNPSGVWVVTGTIGRQAQQRKIVTNYHNGGKPLPLATLLRAHLSSAETARLIGELKKLSLSIAQDLHPVYPKYRSMGVDIGIDRNLHPWIIEVNTKPDRSIFNTLKDKTMYRRIIRYSRLKA